MLQRYTLRQDTSGGGWVLKNRQGDLVAIFKDKANAVSGGRLERAVGGSGTVRIYKADGTFEEERTFPRAADPAANLAR